MERVKSFTHSSTILAFLLLWAPRTALASHVSGGENDLMAVYGGVSLVVGFAGLLGMLGLMPRGWRRAGARWGKWALGAGVLILLAGAYHATSVEGVKGPAGDAAWARLAVQQIVGTLAAFGLFFGGVFYFAKRAGVLDMGEAVKYAMLRNGDPLDRLAYRKSRPGEQRLMFIPFIAMGVLALFFTVGVLIVLARVSGKS